MDLSACRDLIRGDMSKSASLYCAVEITKAYAGSTAPGAAPENIVKCLEQVFEKIEALRQAK